MERLIQSVGRYLQAREELTMCRQNHFLLACPRCKEYERCQTYGEYVRAWVALQAFYEGVIKRKKTEAPQ
jgi:hypothetical protein